MTSRYDNRLVARNEDELYESLFSARNVKFIRQYRTGLMQHPSPGDILELEMIGHIWKVGDRFYKLAQRYYGNSELWWVIAWFNQTPTESHLEIGDGIRVPMPLDKVLGIFDA